MSYSISYDNRLWNPNSHMLSRLMDLLPDTHHGNVPQRDCVQIPSHMIPSHHSYCIYMIERSNCGSSNGQMWLVARSGLSVISSRMITESSVIHRSSRTYVVEETVEYVDEDMYFQGNNTPDRIIYTRW